MVSAFAHCENKFLEMAQASLQILLLSLFGRSVTSVLGAAQETPTRNAGTSRRLILALARLINNLAMIN